MQQVRNIHHAHVGRTYKVVLADDNLPVLEPVETRGRPRGLSGEQVIAARALRNCGRTEEFIADALECSRGAVQTALGGRYA
jgi:hypothetical protein